MTTSSCKVGYVTLTIFGFGLSFEERMIVSFTSISLVKPRTLIFVPCVSKIVAILGDIFLSCLETLSSSASSAKEALILANLIPFSYILSRTESSHVEGPIVATIFVLATLFI